jgi:peptidoglycan biosynthesis protein MviN/MurJ (putative lipid II flippase)
MVQLSKLLLILFALFLLLAPIVSAYDDDEEDEEDDGSEEFSEDLGDIAKSLLIATIVLIAWKPLHLWLQKSGIKNNAESWGITDVKAAKKKLLRFNKWMLRVHIAAGTAATIVGLVHGIGSQMPDWESSAAWAGWIGMLAMSVLGGLIMWKWPPKAIKKRARALHTQRALLVITIILLVAGHEMM